ncbi:MAG TPA: GTPase [Verrucomicrobiae bacterium]|jgi:GTP-binding protein|nr:GTPase [Verrucomicrobiae bacterium]
MFLNNVHLTVQSGGGGHGCESYMGRTDRKRVPDGGDGGRGGRIIFRADNNAPSLMNFRFRQHILAETGGHGGASKKSGANGKDTRILVPVGTSVYDRSRSFLIRELKNNGDEVIAVEGGKGGSGNFGGKEATSGEPGGILEVELTFRIPADVFLVGLPNSGKSALMNRLTNTHLKSEPYPFCTQSPEIGVYEVSDYEKVTLCELPSIYRGSQEGRGCGTDFLAQLEAAKFILYVLDPLSEFASSVKEGYELLREIVGAFNEKLLDIPHAIVINKMDLKEAQAKVKGERFKPRVQVFQISAAEGKNLGPLSEFLKETFCSA